jgi:anaerobic magnesium-protoporphyrin IX monomethyl ester cyclase
MDVFRDYAGGFGVAHPTERGDFGHGPYSLPNVSLMYSAGVVSRLGWQVTYLDAQAERLNLESTLTRATKCKPDVIVSIVNLPSIHKDSEVLSRLKSSLPHTITIAIGTVCRVVPEDIAALSAFDILVHGEAESILPALLNRIQDDTKIDDIDGIGVVTDGKLTMTEPSRDLVDLDELPWPPYNIMPTSLYRTFTFKTKSLPVWASRGCTMPCSFYCPYPVGMGKSLRFRDIEDFVEEIAHLNQNFGIPAFIFRDQIFSSNIGRAEEICELLIGKKLKAQWLCETRMDMVNETLLRKMRKAGCKRIHFGLETGDPEHLRRIGKPGMKISTVKEAIRLTKEAGVMPMAHLLLGLPGETHDTIRQTLKAIRELGLTQISVNIATPYPGTPLFRYAEEKGLLETEDWSHYTSFRPVMRTEEMTAQELEAARVFISENFLGTTLAQRILYLCKNKGIIEAIVRRSQNFWNEPSSIVPILKRLTSEQEASGTIVELD